MKYRKAQGIVLKKQNYRETDQILTIWTAELGKVRVLARGLRASKSKMAYSLQDLSLIKFEMTGRSLPTIISVQLVRNFKGVRSNLAKMAPAFYVTELMLKTTADEHPNEAAFEHLVEFLEVLDSEENLDAINVALNSFTLKLLDCLGFSAEYAEYNFRVSTDLALVIQTLREKDFRDLRDYSIPESLVFNLKSTINKLLEFILERELKSVSIINAFK